MIVTNKAKASLVAAALFAGGLGAGAAVASAAVAGPSSPAAQPAAQYVFACVNKHGQLDYLEFRKPLPHQCWYSGEALWHWAVVPGPTASPSASPSPSSSPSPFPSSSPSPSWSPSPTPSSSPSASSSQ
jgi:hypothetical protein